MNILLLKSVGAKLAVAAGAGLGGFELWRHFYPKLQSLRSVSASGHPIQVVVPVGPKVANLRAIKGQSAAPLPPNNGTAATFTPPAAASAGKLGNEPTVITPTGAANLSVDNVTDIQNALNTLGQQPALAVDGKDGPNTQAAIRSFQASHGMMPDGQPSPALRTALQTALSRIAGTQAHIGQSIPVQAAAAPGATLALNLATSPAGQAVVQAGLAGLASAFSDTPDSDMSADTAASAPPKDAVCNWQRMLNMMGAKPALNEDGIMNPETIAATKAMQVTLGLVADGVPGPKTVTAVAVAASPDAQAVIPSIPKAADHVAVVSSDAPSTTKPALTSAAATLAVSAANPAPTDAQTHASTASAQAATASSAAPTAEIAVPLAAASNSLAAASVTPAPDPAHLADASAALSTAAAAATGTTSAPSIASAADHVAAAATAPDVATQSEHLNAAAAHLANAAAGTPSVGAMTANGEFGWDFFGVRSWWANRKGHFWGWHSALHPAYRPAVPVAPPAGPLMNGEFGYAGYGSGFGGYGGRGDGGYQGQQRHHHHHHRNMMQQQQGMQGGMQGPPPPPPPPDGGDFGYGGGYGGRPFIAPPMPYGRPPMSFVPSEFGPGRTYDGRAMQFDRRWFDEHGRRGQPWGQPGYPNMPPVQMDPNGFQAPDPNAGQPDPALDAQSDGGAQPGD